MEINTTTGNPQLAGFAVSPEVPYLGDLAVRIRWLPPLLMRSVWQRSTVRERYCTFANCYMILELSSVLLLSLRKITNL